MNETEIKWRKQLLKSLANITDHTSSEYEIIANGVKTISFLEQENEKLKERIEYLERSNNRREDTILEQRKEISNLEDKIDKAVEYINKHSRDENGDIGINLFSYNCVELLNILKGVIDE